MRLSKTSYFIICAKKSTIINGFINSTNKYYAKNIRCEFQLVNPNISQNFFKLYIENDIEFEKYNEQFKFSSFLEIDPTNVIDDFY